MQNLNIQNKELYDALSSLTKVILDIISNKIQKNLVITTKSIWKKQNDDSYVKHRSEHPLWSTVLHKANDEIFATQEYKNFLNVIRTDDIISTQLDTLVGTCVGAQRIEAANIAFRPVYEFLTGKEILDFNLSKFNTTYLQIENFLYTKEIEFEKITPLCGFSMEDLKILLCYNISIVKLTEEEILEFFRLGIKLGTIMGNDEFVHGIHKYAIKISYELPKIIYERNNHDNVNKPNEFVSNQHEQNVINALRIFKEGKLYPISTINREKSIFLSGVSFSFEKPVKHFMENKYQLLANEVGEFKEFWERKCKAHMPEKHFLSVAIRRFSQSNERDSIEDRIIDLMICAEAVFLSSDRSNQGELRYRLAHRAAMFIETDVESQRFIFDFMQKAYDVRSSIVHGATPKLPNKKDSSTYSIEDFCMDIERYLRMSIKKAITESVATKNKEIVMDWKSIIFPLNR